MIVENVSALTIHKLTQAQYDRELASGTIDPNALYLTPTQNTNNITYGTSFPSSGTEGQIFILLRE